MVIPLIKEAMTDHQLVISVKSFRVIMLHKENAVMNSRQRIGKTSHSFCLFFMGSTFMIIHAVKKHGHCVGNKQIPLGFGE